MLQKNLTLMPNRWKPSQLGKFIIFNTRKNGTQK